MVVFLRVSSAGLHDVLFHRLSSEMESYWQETAYQEDMAQNLLRNDEKNNMQPLSSVGQNYWNQYPTTNCEVRLSWSLPASGLRRLMVRLDIHAVAQEKNVFMQLHGSNQL